MKSRLIALLILAAATETAMAQTGGSYDLSRNVIAAGGATSNGGTYRVEGTIGQNIAGTSSTGNTFNLHAGFWAPLPLAPTAAGVTVGGRITTADGRGIRNVRMTITDAQGSVRRALSSAFGYYRFVDVLVGESYIFTVSARRFSFSQPVQVRSIVDETNDINFVAENN